MKSELKKIIPVTINGITRKAELIGKKPSNSIKLNIKKSSYNFYELTEDIEEDTHHWFYAVAK